MGNVFSSIRHDVAFRSFQVVCSVVEFTIFKSSKHSNCTTTATPLPPDSIKIARLQIPTMAVGITMSLLKQYSEVSRSLIL